MPLTLLRVVHWTEHQQATEAIDSMYSKTKQLIDHLYVVDGMNFISNANASPYAAGFIRLKDHDKRGAIKDPDEIAGMLTKR